MKKDNLYNEIVITSDTWGDKTAERLGYTIMTLAREGEVCKVYDDSKDIYIIQHNHNEEGEYWGGPVCTWLTEKENDNIITTREYEEDPNVVDDENEPAFDTISTEFYFEISELLKQYNSNEISAEDTLEKIAYILNKEINEED